MDAKRSALITALFLCLVLAGCGGGSDAPPADPVHWNFLVYLDGDNNLEPAAIDDINEMEAANSSQYVDIYVLVDRSPGWTNPVPGDDTSNGNWTNTRLYKITHDTDPANITSTELTTANGGYFAAGTELDMSDPATLQAFVTWGMSQDAADGEPAERTVLTLWNHGSDVYPRAVAASASVGKKIPSGEVTVDDKVVRGICWDDTTGSSIWNCLTTDEVRIALANAQTAVERKIDIIHMDACNMQMLEVAYEWRNEANYLVGSEHTVPGDGNNYTGLLNALAASPGLTAREFAIRIVDVYQSSYSGSGLDTTFSAIILGDPFTTLISTFATFATALRYTTDLDGAIDAWEHTTFFNGSIGLEDNDLYDFAGELVSRCSDATVTAAAANLRTAVGNAVIRNRTTGIYNNNAHGVAILLPTSDEWPYFDDADRYPYLQLSVDTDWNEFIARFATAY